MTARLGLSLTVLILAVVSPSVAGWIPLTDVEIRLQRTSCLGECPVYSVTVRGDGHVAFDGQQFTAHHGSAEWSIDEARVLELINRFLDADFFDANVELRPRLVRIGSSGGLEVIYGMGIDGSGATVTFKLGDQERTIRILEDTQLDIRDLPNVVDDYAKTETWVRGSK